MVVGLHHLERCWAIVNAKSMSSHTERSRNRFQHSRLSGHQAKPDSSGQEPQGCFSRDKPLKTKIWPLLVPVQHLKKRLASEITLPQMKFHVSPCGTDLSKLRMGKPSFMADFAATAIRKMRNAFDTSVDYTLVAMLNAPKKNECHWDASLAKGGSAPPQVRNVSGR